MPIAGLLCSQHGEILTGDDEVSAHFGLNDCLHVPRAHALHVLHGNDDRPDGWTVTEVIDHSIRKQMIQKCVDYYVDPARHMSMMTGRSVEMICME